MMKCPTIEVLDIQIARLRLQVHASWCHIPAGFEFLRVENINLGRIAREFRLRTGKFKAARLANDTAASVTTNEPFGLKRGFIRHNSYAGFGLMEAGNGHPTFDLYTK